MKTSLKEFGSTLSKKNASMLANQLNATHSSSLTFDGNSTINLLDKRIFVKVYHGDMKFFLLNSLSSCMHLINHIKEQLRLPKEDVIDLIDFDGVLREVPSSNNKDYAIQFLVPTSSYTVLKIDIDPNTNEKRYTCLLSENKLNHNIQKTLASLNASKQVRGRPTGTKSKQQASSLLPNQSTASSSSQLATNSGMQSAGGQLTARKTTKQSKS